ASHLSRLFWFRQSSCPSPSLCTCGKAARLSTCAQAVFADRRLFMPGLSLLHVRELCAHALVVVRVEPEHAGKYLLRVPQAAEAPQAEAVAVEAPEEGAVLYNPPGKEAAEVLAEGELPDLHPHVVVTDRRVWIMIEREVPEVGVGVEATEIGGKEVHEFAVRLFVVTRLFQLDGLYDGVRVGILEVPAGEDDLYPVDGSGAFLDDGPRPRLNGFVRLSPIVILGVPRPLLLQGQGREAESRYVGAPGRDLARQVGMARVAPHPSRHHGDDLARHSLEEAGRAKRKGTLRSEDAAGDRVPLYRKGDEVDLPAHDEILSFRLRLLSGGELRIGIDAEPRAVGGD